MKWRILGNVFCDSDPKVKGQIIYFPANASPAQLLGVAISNFAGAGHMK